jgi:hypothetical protein
MKKLILAISLLLSTTADAQLVDGTYYCSRGIYTVSAIVCEAGEEICSFEINYNDTLVISGTGDWFRVNMRGVDEEYDGPEGWYVIQLDSQEIEADLISDQKFYMYNPIDKQKIILKLQE